MGILDKIKEESKKAGQSKGKFIYFREGEKTRIRFLTEFDEGMEIVFHDSFQLSINVPCQEMYGKTCEYCGREDLRTRSLFAWSVWDYEAKEVKILMQAVNNCTAIPAFMAFYEEYGTLLDRDYVVRRDGKQQNTVYTIMPQDKNSFKNKAAKPLSESAILKYLAKAYPDENSTDDEDYEEEEKPKKNPKGKEDDFMNKPEGDDGWDEDENSTPDYESMKPRELYNLCKERGINVLPKKPERYYIKQLEEFDKANDDWGEEDEWEEELPFN